MEKIKSGYYLYTSVEEYEEGAPTAFVPSGVVRARLEPEIRRMRGTYTPAVILIEPAEKLFGRLQAPA